MSMKTYTKEFYKIKIRSGHHESSKEKVAKYVNVLKFHVWDKLSMWKLKSLGNAYCCALKSKEKLGRKKGKHMTKVDWRENW